MSSPTEPVGVGQLVVTSIEAFFEAAAWHLGDPLPDGRRLDAPDPQEAWRALFGASALIQQFSPIMAEAKLVPYQAGLAHLLKRLATAFPTAEFPLPGWLGEAIARPQGIQAPARVVPVETAPDDFPPVPARPSAGLPIHKGPDLLFPRQ